MCLIGFSSRSRQSGNSSFPLVCAVHRSLCMRSQFNHVPRSPATAAASISSLFPIVSRAVSRHDSTPCHIGRAGSSSRAAPGHRPSSARLHKAFKYLATRFCITLRAELVAQKRPVLENWNAKEFKWIDKQSRVDLIYPRVAIASKQEFSRSRACLTKHR